MSKQYAHFPGVLLCGVGVGGLLVFRGLGGSGIKAVAGVIFVQSLIMALTDYQNVGLEARFLMVS